MSDAPKPPEPAPGPAREHATTCDVCRGWDRSGPTAFFFVCRNCRGCRACCARELGHCGFVAPNRRWRKLLESHGRKQGQAAAKKQRAGVTTEELPPSRR